MTTMADVAQATGVSIQTISAVIHDKPDISQATRERVRRAIEELDYHPNMLASSLRSQRTLTIGVLISSITNPYFPELVRGVEDLAHRHGYAVFLCNTDGNPDKQLSYLRLLRRNKVAGLFAATGLFTPDERRIIEYMAAHGVPVVVREARVDYEKIVSLDVDDYRGEFVATTHLLDLGHRRIGIITGPSDSHVTAARLSGYRDALRHHDVALDPTLIVPGGFDAASGRIGAEQLMRLSAPPTALVAANDLCAIGAISSVKRMGKRVPEDVAVVGYDNIEMAALYDPPLTTVAQPLYDIGACAMQTILDRLRDPTVGGTRISFDTRLIARQSTVTARPPKNDESSPTVVSASSC